MPHFLDGDWNLFTFNDRMGNIDFNKDGTLIHLEHDGNNRLRSTSKHGSNDLSGSSLPVPSSQAFNILIFEKVPIPGGSFQYRPYQGVLIDQKLVTGTLVKVMGGFLRPLMNALPPLPFDADEFRNALAAQQDGIWVATQP